MKKFVKGKDKYITLRCTAEFKQKVLDLADRHQVPMASIVKIALVDYIKKSSS